MTVSRVSTLAQISKCPAPANATPRESSKLSENALYRQRLDESVVRVLPVLLKAKDVLSRRGGRDRIFDGRRCRGPQVETSARLVRRQQAEGRAWHKPVLAHVLTAGKSMFDLRSYVVGTVGYLSGVGSSFSENLIPRAVNASPAIGDTTPVRATRWPVAGAPKSAALSAVMKRSAIGVQAT